MKLLPPTLHLNGTSFDELESQWLEVGRAANALREALRAASPNARDYYPQEPGAFEVARAAHEKLEGQAQRIYTAAAEMLEALAEANDARRP